MLALSVNDYTKITDGLYIGSAPAPGPLSFDVLALCAEEYQPRSEEFPRVKVLHVPMLDEEPARFTDLKAAYLAARELVKYWRDGSRVLVTCMAGLNRSGLVVCLMLMLRYKLSTDSAVRILRAKRGAYALGNLDFHKFLYYVETTFQKHA